MSSFDARRFKSIRAIRDHVLVSDMNFKEKLTHGGIIIPNSDGKLEGVHARWGRVYAIGNEQQDVRPGQYVLVKHGRWTRGVDIEEDNEIKTLRRVDHEDILLVSDEPMEDESPGNGI
jgi:co-chaperonin GroES (HSP10)